jgi:hypothetical protein
MRATCQLGTPLATWFPSNRGNLTPSILRKEIAMRALFFLIAIVLVLALVGWISFSKSPGRSSINIETQQIQQDTNRALEKGSDLLHKAGESVERPAAPTTQPPQPQPVR